MDEAALRTLFAARQAKVRRDITATTLDFIWTIVEMESQYRLERYEAAIKAGKTESEALMSPLPPMRVYTDELADSAGIDRRRVWEQMQMVLRVGSVKIIDRRKSGVGGGYYDVEVIHLAPDPRRPLMQPNPTLTFDFLLDDGDDAAIESDIQRRAIAETQREASPDQRHRSADQRAGQEGRPEPQRGHQTGRDIQLRAMGSPVGGQGLAVHEPGLDSLGAPPVEQTAARRFSGAQNPARRFSGAQNPARRFSGAPTELIDDDGDGIALGVEEEHAHSRTQQETPSSSSSTSSVQFSRRAKSGAQNPARRFSGAQNPARRFSGAQNPARRFSGAPTELIDDDGDGIALGVEEEHAHSRTQQETPSSSSTSSVQFSRRAKSGAQNPARRFSGAPAETDPADLLRQIGREARRCDPEELDWEEIRAAANAAGTACKLPGSPRALEPRARHLVLAAAIVAVCVPELGRDWLDRAIEEMRERRPDNRAGYFRTCLASGIEDAELCESDPSQERPIAGLRAFGRLEVALSHCVRWFDQNVDSREAPR